MPSVKVFLDTNVLIYAATAMNDDPRKHMIAMDIIASTPFVVSVQVMAEFVSVSRRTKAPRLSEDAIEWWLSRMEIREPLPLTPAIVRRGREISVDHGLNYYDGAILAAAERLGCDTVLSEDMTDGRAYGGVTVRNSFRDS
jgi:predicted nucleic acid-binding protein